MALDLGPFLSMVLSSEQGIHSTAMSLSRPTFPKAPQSFGHTGMVPSCREGPRSHACAGLHLPAPGSMGVWLSVLRSGAWDAIMHAAFCSHSWGLSEPPNRQQALFGRQYVAVRFVQHATVPLPEISLHLSGPRHMLPSDPVMLLEDFLTASCCHFPASGRCQPLNPPGTSSYVDIP